MAQKFTAFKNSPNIEIFLNCLTFKLNEPTGKQNSATRLYGSTVCATSRASVLF